MTDERDVRESDGAWLEEIGRDLNVEPSPAFAVRVRAAVEAEVEAGRAGFWNRWLWAGAALVAAAAAIAVMTWARPPVSSAPIAPQQAAVVPIRPPLPTKAPEPPSASSAPVRVPQPTTSSATQAAFRGRSSQPVATVARLDMNVQTDQPDVVRRLWRGVSMDAIDPVAADAKFRDALVASTAPPADVAEIVVEPISIKPLDLPETAAGRAGGQRLIAIETTRSR